MINPTLFHIGPLEIRYYGILFALAFIIGYFIAIKLAPKFKIKKQTVEDYIPWAIILVVVGARLFEVLFYDPSYYFANPLKILTVWEGGLASHGAIIALILGTIYFCKKKKISFYNFSDLFVIPIALGAAFVRIGNFLNSELVGKITSVPWAVKFLGYEGLRHPVQLYQSFGYLAIFGILLYLVNIKKKLKGLIFWSFLFLDSLFRLITEFFKDLPPSYGFELIGLNLAQWISIVIILISLKPLYNRIKHLHKQHGHL